MKYDFKQVEAKWQKRWEEEHAFEAEDNSSKPKYSTILYIFLKQSALLANKGLEYSSNASFIESTYTLHIVLM